MYMQSMPFLVQIAGFVGAVSQNNEKVLRMIIWREV